MKSLLGRYWALYLAGVTVLGCVFVIVLIQTYNLNYGPARWFFSYISKWTVTSSTLKFIADWTESLSAAAAILVVIAVLLEVRAIRRKRASARVQKWAKDAVAELTRPSGEISVANRIADWKRRIIPIRIEGSNALADARACSNGLELKVDKAVKTLLEFEYYLNDRTDSADIKNSLKTTVGAFAEVIR